LIKLLTCVGIFEASGNFSGFQLASKWPKIIIITIMATIVEALPIDNIDNILVPAIVIPLSNAWL
jgi:hypothetical protein